MTRSVSNNPGGEGIRLNKALAQAGAASRRGADELIRTGRVAVNDTIVTDMGLRVRPGLDRVTLDGAPLAVGEDASTGHVYLMLNKPAMVVSTASDPEGRTTVLDFLPKEFKKYRLFPVGRLDYFSEGLLLLTNDGELTMRLTHPRYHLTKLYHVRTREIPTHEALQTMRKGMRLAEGETLAPVGVQLLEEKPPAMLMTLSQGVNRQIRRMCRDLDLTILSLRRIRTGPLELGTLAKGGVRALTEKEVRDLKKAVGLA